MKMTTLPAYVQPTTSYQVTTPEAFNFSDPSEWPRWIQRFDRFMTATGLVKQPEEVQVWGRRSG